MKVITRLLAAAFVLFASGLAAFGQDEQGTTPLWVRYPAISPDGTTIAFTYRGQIYVVDAEGGLAIPVTSQGYYSYGAVWSPDSESLAFASDINGDDDVYVADFSGPLQRRTWSSRAEVPTSFSPDGESVLFTALRLGDAEASVQAPLTRRPQLHSVSLASGRETLLLPNLAEEASWNADGTRLLYSQDRSGDPKERQHRVASNARQVWIYNAITDTHEPLFAEEIDTFNPLWGPDDESIFYLSEESGTLNVWRLDLSTGGKSQLTDFTGRPVRALSVSAAGDVAFSHNGAIHTLMAGETEPRAIEVIVPEQLMEQPERYITSQTAEFLSSPTGLHFAAIVNADVFLLDRAGNARQITATPEEERNVTFSPDGTMLVYAAQRDHRWGLYGVDLDLEDNGGELALAYEETPLVVEPEMNAFQPGFSPDGSKIAFIADRREVKIYDLETGGIVTLFAPGEYNTSYYDGDQWYIWSPTSLDLAVQWRTIFGSPTQHVGIAPADGSGPIQPVGAAIADLRNGVWSADGTHLVLRTLQFSVRQFDSGALAYDLYQLFLSEDARRDFLDAYEGNPPLVWPEQDEDGEAEPYFAPARYLLQADRPAHLERRLSSYSGVYPALVPLDDLRSLLIANPAGGGVEIDLLDLKTGDVTGLSLIEADGISDITYVPALNVLDVKAGDGVLTLSLQDPAQIAFTPIEITYSVLPPARRAAAFEQAWADIRDTYYREDLEGRDWDGIGRYYRSLLGSIASDRELADLLRAMSGELSASHLFVTYDAPYDRASVPNSTGSLGIFLDHSYEGEGRRIAALLPGGPLDRANLGIDPGDVIASINGVPVPDAGGIDLLLEGMRGRSVAIGIRDGEDEDPRLVTVTPISQYEEAMLHRAHWIDTRRAIVSDLSNACIVYEYVPQMNNAAYVSAHGRLLGASKSARAALIDVRSNTGGNLHRQLLNLLTGTPFGILGREGREWDSLPADRWQSPSAVLVDNFAYSDGSIFPQAYQDEGVGPLVGDRLLNTGTSVNYVDSRILEGLNYAIPVLPYRRLDGSYYENNEIVPDILVPFDPNSAGKGIDAQLEAAIAALMDEIGPDSDCRVPGTL